LSDHKLNPLIVTVSCVVGLLTMSPTWAAGLQAETCTNGGNCLLFQVTNVLTTAVYISIEDSASTCYGPSDPYSYVSADGGVSTWFDIPDDSTCTDLDETTAKVKIYDDASGTNKLCTFSLSKYFDDINEYGIPMKINFYVNEDSDTGNIECLAL
jgi:hypothetical protein